MKVNSLATTSLVREIIVMSHVVTKCVVYEDIRPYRYETSSGQK